MLTTTDISRMGALCDAGRYQEAYDAARHFGFLRRWQGQPARLLAGRLASLLGSPRLAAALRYLGWREDRTQRSAQLAYAYTLVQSRSPYAAWKFLRQCGDPADADVALQSDWWVMRADLACIFRDFDAADQWHKRAAELVADRPWLWVRRSNNLIAQDRYGEALEVSAHALRLQADFPPAIRQHAENLVLAGRDEEALELLNRAAETAQCGHVWLELANLQSEQGLHRAALASYQKATSLFPLMERGMAHWLAGRRSDTAYLCGDFDTAREMAWLAANAFHVAVARCLTESGDDATRRLLSVPFVRQHHLTCVPATLSAICRYWSAPVDHLEIAAKICYDGTSSYNTRQWATQQGWVVREFTVTWESVRALLDREIPIAVTTVEPTNAHMQALVGYDTRRGTLLVRDPYHRQLSEFLIDEFLRRYAFCGPRGIVLAPPEKAPLLAECELPDAELHDQLHALQGYLMMNERQAAQEVIEAMEQSAAGHRLTVETRRCLAHYDADYATALACTEQLLELYPDNPALQLQQLGYLESLGRRADRLEMVIQLCGNPRSHPVFQQYYAAELISDARTHQQAFRLLRRVLRAAPTSPDTYHWAAGILWQQRRFVEAIPLNRLAACLDDKDERYVRAYFTSARFNKSTDDVLDLLRGRVRRYATRSGEPFKTLFWALDQLDRTTEAFSVIEEALRVRVEDGDLRLFAADAYARYGNFDAAQDCLEAARDTCHRGNWLRTAAHIAAYRGYRAIALTHWREVLAHEPQAMDAQQAVVQLLAEVEGPLAAQRHLADAVGQWPHNYPLRQLQLCYLREEDLPAARAAAEHIVAYSPSDGWARRELAVIQARLGDLPQALREARQALDMEPNQPETYCVLGFVYRAAGQLEQAKLASREAIRRSVDTEYAITLLIACCQSVEDQREQLGYIADELARQVIFGSGLVAFRNMAAGILPPAQLLQILREGKTARPDLPQTWSALVWQLAEMQLLDEAFSLAEEATRRFPLVSSTWYDLAYIEHHRGDPTAAQDALRHVLEIAPQFTSAARQLARQLESEQDLAAARQVLERAAAHEPLEVENHCQLAEVLWQLEQPEAAMESIKRAILIDPDCDAAWERLLAWAEQRGTPELPGMLAENLVSARPGNAACWIAVAQALSRPEDLPRRQEAIDQAIALQPHLVVAHEWRAFLLAEAGDTEAALAACRHPVFGEHPPAPLRARAAELEAHRGNLESAVQEMTAALSLDPQQELWWSRLLYWLSGLNLDRYCQAARQYCNAVPGQPQAWWQLAEGLRAQGMRAEAKEAFRRLLALDPRAEIAAARLCLMYIEDGDIAAAHECLQSIRQHVNTPGTEVLACETRLHLARADWPAASGVLRTLCTTPCDNSQTLRALANLAVANGRRRALLELLDVMLDAPDVQSSAAEVWGSLQLDWPERFQERLTELWNRPDLWQQAVAGYMAELARCGYRTLLSRFVDSHRDQLRAADFTWGAAGTSLLQLGLHDRAAQWLADWRQRDCLKDGVMLEAADAMFVTGRASEALAIHRSCETVDDPSMAVLHSLWLIAHALAHGKLAEAAPHCQRMMQQPLPTVAQDLGRFVETALAIEESWANSGRGSFPQARARLEAACAQCSVGGRQSRRLQTYYLQYLRRLAIRRGSLWQRLIVRLRLATAGRRRK